MTSTKDQRTAAPVSAICEALGVPRQDWPLFVRWADQPLTAKN
jgi:cytochrome P450